MPTGASSEKLTMGVAATAVFRSPRFQVALDLAARGHDGQKRKGTKPEIPYITHPVAVACLTVHYGGSEDAVLAALVHDLPEDTPIKLDEIERVLGRRVREIVAALTEEKAFPWVIRKRLGIEKYRSADAETRLVGGLDKLHALLGFARDPKAREDTFWDRFNAGKAVQAWYYHAVAAALACESFGDEMPRLAAEVFGPAPAGNPCTLYLKWAFLQKEEKAAKAFHEARNLWLNAEPADHSAMLSAVDEVVAAPDGHAASGAALFLGFAGRESKGADERLARILETDQRPRVLAAALTALEQILDDIHAGSPDAGTLGSLAAAVALREPEVTGEVEEILRSAIRSSDGDTRFVEAALARLRRNAGR